MATETRVPAGLVVRQATPDDAAACLEHAARAFEEFPLNFLYDPGEFDMTVEQERAYIEAAAARDNDLFLVALVDGNVVGVLTYEGGRRRANRHAVSLGVSVRAAWCGQGIGTALMRAAIDHARSGGVVRRIELHVYPHNDRAAALYRRLGFVEEGRRRRAVIKGGEYADDIVMALLIG